MRDIKKTSFSFKRFFGGALFLIIFYFWVTLPSVTPLMHQEPSETRFMKVRIEKLSENGKEIVLARTWVPLSKISNHLQRAVIAAEDARFFEHRGFDWESLKSAFQKNWKKGSFVRGGSTITQQLAKNLYLTPQKSLWRKAREFIIAWKMERILNKERILELYLNYAEWGPGVFGAEAASRYYFKKPASKLTATDAAFLAVILPNPIKYGKKPLAAKLQRRMNRILRDMNEISLKVTSKE